MKAKFSATFQVKAEVRYFASVLWQIYAARGIDIKRESATSATAPIAARGASLDSGTEKIV
jgi:hypothetical protein